MKKRQKERHIKRAQTKIIRIDAQIIKLDSSYNNLLEKFGEKHAGVKMAAIKLEYMRNLLLAKKTQEQAIIDELSK